MARDNYPNTLRGWEQMLIPLEGQIENLPLHLKEPYAELVELLKEARELALQQRIHQAAKQEATQKLRDVLDRGRRTASFVRVGLKQHHGKQSERLVEYGVRPFRRRSRKKTDSPSPAESLQSSE